MLVLVDASMCPHPLTHVSVVEKCVAAPPVTRDAATHFLVDGEVSSDVGHQHVGANR